MPFFRFFQQLYRRHNSVWCRSVGFVRLGASGNTHYIRDEHYEVSTPYPSGIELNVAVCQKADHRFAVVQFMKRLSSPCANQRALGLST